jgi:hypothetical protein
VRIKSFVLAAAAAVAVSLALPAVQASAAPARPAAAPRPGGFVAARPVPSALGSGWTAAYWKAESGGYAAPSEQSPFAPLVSSTKPFTWYYRSLGLDFRHGTNVEIVNPAGTYAVVYRSGQWVLQTPDAAVTQLVRATGLGCTGSYCPFGDPGFHHFVEPSGKNQPLRAPSSETLPRDGWTGPNVTSF